MASSIISRHVLNKILSVIDFSGGKKPRIEKEEDEEVQVVERSRSAETWQEQMEKEDTSEFFTMDYHRVRRRRPIHNKSFPAVTVSP